MSPDEVKTLCERLLPLTQKEAYTLLKEYGLNPKAADMLRHLLGITKTKILYSRETKDEIYARLKKGDKLESVADEYGVAPATIYTWIRDEEWTYARKRDFWTAYKIRQLCAGLRKNMSYDDLRMQLNAPNKACIVRMALRLRKHEHVKKWLPIIAPYGF